jgi:hypothetical protein
VIQNRQYGELRIVTLQISRSPRGICSGLHGPLVPHLLAGIRYPPRGGPTDRIPASQRAQFFPGTRLPLLEPSLIILDSNRTIVPGDGMYGLGSVDVLQLISRLVDGG